MSRDAAVSGVERVLRRPYRVRFDEAGRDGTVRASTLLRFAQDLAWRHSDLAGFDRAWYAQRGLAWLVRAVDLALLAPIAMGDDVEMTTGVVGYRKVWARRRSEALVGAAVAAIVQIDWVLVDGRGAPSRVPPEIERLFPGEPVPMQLARVDLPPTPGGASRLAFRVRPHELDPNDHVNNAVYVDWLDEAALATPMAAAVPTALPRRYRVEYLAAAGAGAELASATWPDGSAWCQRVVAADGAELIRARLET
jgi:acyl-ACP thioesterase